MKFLIIGLLALSPLSSFASEEIYRALNVEESGDSFLTVKSLYNGGIRCFKNKRTSVTNYECEFNFNKFNSEEAYNALNVVEKNVDGFSQKEVGALICRKDKMGTRSSYSCSLKTMSQKYKEPRE